MTCATKTRSQFVYAKKLYVTIADMMHGFGSFKLPITSLFMVRNIKCGYSFS